MVCFIQSMCSAWALLQGEIRTTRYLLHLVGKKSKKNKWVEFKPIQVETHMFSNVRDACQWNKIPQEIILAPSPHIFLNKSGCCSQKHYFVYEL